MLDYKTREQVNAEALDAADRAYRIATGVDLLPEHEAIGHAIQAYLAASWQPIRYAPQRPYLEHRSDKLLLRSSKSPCAEGRWYARDGESIFVDGWYILGFSGPVKVEPTHFQYLLK